MVTKQSRRASATFAAIAHPIRRELLDTLRRGELPAGELAARFPVSRPAISRHLKVLRRAGLVRERRRAQARIYALEPRYLAEVDRWLQPYRLFWATRLAELKRVVEAPAASDSDPTPPPTTGDDR